MYVFLASPNNETEAILLTEFLKYDMKGKIIINVTLPPLSNCCFVKTYKVCKSYKSSS